MGCGSSTSSATPPCLVPASDGPPVVVAVVDVDAADAVPAPVMAPRKSTSSSAASQLACCGSGCGRPPFGRFETCCQRCRGPDGPHSEDCEQKSLCGEGCGRRCGRGPDGRQFKTCCKSCPHLKKEKGIAGHDSECDVRSNGGLTPPWYWRSAAKWPDDFHDEAEGDYVRKMGTKLIQQGLPNKEVLRCCRVEDSILWKKYTAKRSQIRERAVAIQDVKPETAQNIDFSAMTTLDRTVNEFWLFHGTSEDAAKAIVKSNFICSSGGCFGKGAYFAESSSKSDSYAKGTTEDGCKVMMLCRVTLGSIKDIGTPDRAAEKHVVDPNFDSVLGKTNHREFIVYDVAQIYPEYIMYYKEKTG